MDSVLGDSPAKYEDKDKLIYTEWVIRESLRLFPPAPVTVRALTKELVLRDGFKAAEGQTFYIPIQLIHTSPSNYPDRPLEFVPERWAGEIPSSAWVPFSAGRRDCLGRRFAMLEAVLGLASLTQKFEFKVSPDFKLKMKSAGPVQHPVELPVELIARKPISK